MVNSEPGVIDESGQFYKYDPEVRYYRKNQFNKITMAAVILGAVLIISVFVGNLLYFVNNFDNTFDQNVLVDEYDHTISPLSEPIQLELLIGNIGGDIIIERNDASSTVEIHTDVYRKENSDADYLQVQWDLAQVGGIQTATFDVPDDSFFQNDLQDLQYDHFIYVPSDIEFVDFDINTVSGDIFIEFEESQVLNDVNVKTVSGDIDFVLLGENIITGQLDLETVSGEIDIILDYSTLEISSFDLNTVSGGISLTMMEINFLADVNVNLEVASGDVNIEWLQSSLTTAHYVEVDAISGNIEIGTTFDPSISLSWEADAEFDEIEMPADHIGTSGAVEFDLNTVSGSIDVSF